MAGRKDTRGQALLDPGREVEQPERVADMRPGAPDLLCQLLVGGAEVIEQLLIGRRLFQRVKLLAVQVLDQGIPEQVIVLGLLDDGADLGQAGPLRGPPSALTHDELVPAGPGRANDYRLEQADLLDRLGELVKRVLVEGASWLPWVWGNGGDRDLRVLRADNLGRS